MHYCNFLQKKLLLLLLLFSAGMLSASPPHPLQNILRYLGKGSQNVEEKLQERENIFSKKESHLWFLFADDSQKEELADDYYHEAVVALQSIGKKLQKWEEDYAEDIDTPENRESMQEELASLLEELETNIEKAIEVNPDHPGYYIIQGVKEMMLGHFEQAKENFSLSLQLNPDFSDLENDLLPGDANLLIEICNSILKQTPKV